MKHYHDPPCMYIEVWFYHEIVHSLQGINFQGSYISSICLLGGSLHLHHLFQGAMPDICKIQYQ